MTNAAEWFAAIGTVGAVFAAIGLHVADVLDRKRAHARRVAIWAEWDRRVEGDSARQYFAYVRNSGEAPVYVDRFLSYPRLGAEPWKPIRFGLVPPQETKGFGLPVEVFSPTDNPPFLEMFFKDVEEQVWRRDSQGSLQRIRGGADRLPRADSVIEE